VNEWLNVGTNDRTNDYESVSDRYD